MGADVQGYGAAFGFGLFFCTGRGHGPRANSSRTLFKNEERWPRLIGQLIMVSGLFYITVGLTLEMYLGLTVLLVICAHCASGANWVLSTIMMQRWVEDEVRACLFGGHADPLGSVFMLDQCRWLPSWKTRH